MKGIELTQESDNPVWVSLNSISQIKPYMGFDGKETGTLISIGLREPIRVMETYGAVVELLNNRKSNPLLTDYVDDDESYA